MKVIRYVGLGVCCLILASCSGCRARRGRSAPSTAKVALTLPCVRKVDVPSAAFFRDLGLEVCHFEVRGLKDHKVTIWIETYKDGELLEDLSWGSWKTPPKNEPVEERFRFSRRHRPASGPNKPKQVIWHFGFDGSTMNLDWRDDPLHGLNTVSMGFRSDTVTLVDGATVTIWSMGASNRASMSMGEDEMVKQNPLAVLIKCRMDSLAPSEQRSVHGKFSGTPPD